MGLLPSPVVAEIRNLVRGPRADAVLTHLELAVDLLGRGLPGKAVVEAETAKKLTSRAPVVREVLGLAYYELKRYRDALKEFQAYRRITGREDQNHLAADCHRALGEPGKALPLVKAELAAEDVAPPAKAEAAVVGASALADQGNYTQALAMLRRVRTRADIGRPQDLRVWYVTGDILAREGRPLEAAEQFRKIIAHDADAFDAAERLADLPQH